MTYCFLDIFYSTGYNTFFIDLLAFNNSVQYGRIQNACRVMRKYSSKNIKAAIYNTSSMSQGTIW